MYIIYYIYIYIIYLIIYIVFFLTSVSKCACFKAFGRAAAFPYRLRKTQGATVCVQKGVVRRWMVVGRGCH